MTERKWFFLSLYDQKVRNFATYKLLFSFQAKKLLAYEQLTLNAFGLALLETIIVT